MVLGEWQRSGYRRRVFFSSQTHCGTARQLEWKHRSSQLQSTGLFWGGREAEDFLSKYRHCASLRRLGIIFIGAKRLKRVEPRKKTNSESNNLELRSVSYADRTFGETSLDRDFFGAADAIVCMNRTVFPRLIDDKDLDSSVRPAINLSHPETSSQPGPPAFPFAPTGQSGRCAPRLKWLSVLDLVLVQRAGQSRTEAATQQLS